MKDSKVVVSEPSKSEFDAKYPNCPICLSTFDGFISSPDVCQHKFCLDCLQEWSKVNLYLVFSQFKLNQKI